MKKDRGVKAIAAAPGDPAGIGYEISVRALEALRSVMASEIVAVYGNREIFHRAAEAFAPSLEVIDADSIEEADEAGKIYIIEVMPEFDIGRFEAGVMSAMNAVCAHRSLMRIIEDSKRGLIGGLCTGPIHKGAMRLAGVPEIGHTEILSKGFGAEHPMTLFITRELRIFFYSRHLSLRGAIEALSVDGLYDFGLRMDAHIREIGFEKPRLAMAALNPHASDGGQFGHEEAEILIPAAERLRRSGVNITDPIGADSVFAQAAEGRYDAVLSLYHDQGHIAAKTYDFARTISATLGLPILRTSVDHGTAFDIAWQGKAQSVSMATALEALMRYRGR